MLQLLWNTLFLVNECWTAEQWNVKCHCMQSDVPGKSSYWVAPCNTNCKLCFRKISVTLVSNWVPMLPCTCAHLIQQLWVWSCLLENSLLCSRASPKATHAAHPLGKKHGFLDRMYAKSCNVMNICSNFPHHFEQSWHHFLCHFHGNWAKGLLDLLVGH